MARRPFGGTPSDVVQDARGNARQRATGTAWTAQVGGTQITDLAAPDGTLLPDGVITAGQRGEVQFLGSNDDRALLWADFGNGRFLMLATDLPDRVEELSTGVDLHDARLGDVEAALPDKADLVGGTVPDAQIPSTIARDAEVTAAVNAAVAALVAGAPGALDTLNELATQLASDESAAAALTALVATKAPLASPALTGTPTKNGSPVLSQSDAAGTLEPVGGESVRVPLRNTYNKIAAINAGAARFKWLTMFDSFAQKIQLQVGTLVQQITGGAGGAYFSGSFSGVTKNSSSGTVTDNTADFTKWPDGRTTTLGSAGASRTYGIGGTSFVCDTIKVFHINDGNGTFKIQVDGVDNTTPTVTSDNSLGITTLSVARGAHTVTLVQLTGTPKVLDAPGFEDSQASGLVPINIAQGGVALNSPTSQAWTNFQTFLANVLPDLMTFEADEDSSYFAAALTSLFTATAAGAPKMDVVGIGAPPRQTNDADRVIQNAQLRAACEAAGYAYYDTYALLSSFAKLDLLDWEGDGLHVNVKADQYRGMLFLRDSGFLNLYGRMFQQRPVTPKVIYQRAQDSSSPGATQADPSTGLDLQTTLARYLKIMDSTGTTERWRMSGTGDITDFMPDKVRIGSTTGPAISAESNVRAGVRRGDATGSSADFQARTYANGVVTLSNQSGAVTLDLSSGAEFVVNMTGNVTSWSFSNVGTGGQKITVHFVQDATGGRTVAGANASIKLRSGFALGTAASKRSTVLISQISGSYYQVAPEVTDVG